MDAIGRLVCDGARVATAFVVDPEGLSATAAHVLDGRRSGRWTFEPLAAPGLSLAVNVDLPADSRTDVALCSVTGDHEWQPMTLVAHGDVSPSAPVHLRGFAESYDYDAGVGSFVGLTGEEGRTWVKVSCPHAQPGMSGAPVLLTGTSGVLGLVSARLNAERWNRDTVLVAPSADVVALAPDRLHLAEPVGRHRGGTLRLSWDRDGSKRLILQTDDFHVSFGRNETNRVRLDDSNDSRFHGTLSLTGRSLVYHHSGSQPAHLVGATRQVAVPRDDWIVIENNDRLRFASGTVLVEFAAPDLYDRRAIPTTSPDDPDEEVTNGGS